MEWIELGKLANIEIGRTPSRRKPEYWNGSNTWVSIADMNKKDISSSKEGITDLALKETNIKVVPKDTVIMSFKLSIGKRAITTEDVYTNEAIAAFHIINDNVLLNRYLYYCLGFIDLLRYTDKAAMGKTLNKSKLNIIKIPVPLMEIQKQIVEVLDEAQKLINNRKEQLKLLDYLIKSIFYDMFGDPVNNEKNWQVKQLNEILSGDMQNGLYKPHTDYTTETSKGTPIIRIDGFYYGKITEENHKRVLCSDKEIHKYNVNVGDILINRVNSLEYLGKSAHVTNITESTVFESNIMKFRVDTTIVDNLYFIYLLNTDFIKNQILGRAKKSVNQASINQKDVKSFLVTIPPIQLQNQFAEKVELIEKQKSLLEQSLKLLEDNYNNLMQRAFKGELF